jgi:hypothetical protein
MTSVTSQVVEARTGKMVTANKLAALQKIKWEKRVFFVHFLIISQNKRNVRIGSDQACHVKRMGCDSIITTLPGQNGETEHWRVRNVVYG